MRPDARWSISLAGPRGEQDAMASSEDGRCRRDRLFRKLVPVKGAPRILAVLAAKKIAEGRNVVPYCAAARTASSQPSTLSRLTAIQSAACLCRSSGGTVNLMCCGQRSLPALSLMWFCRRASCSTTAGRRLRVRGDDRMECRGVECERGWRGGHGWRRTAGDVGLT